MENKQEITFKNKIAFCGKRVKDFVVSKGVVKVIVPVAIVLIIATAICGVITLLNNYVIFPRVDKALANSFEAKLDVGTRFDISDLFEKGKIELSADDVQHIGMGNADLDLSLSYNKKGASGSLEFGNRRFDVVITENGAAASSPQVENGTRYGVYFESLASDLGTSFLNPDNKAQNALGKYEYEKLLSFAQKLEDKANSDGKEKKDALIVLKEVAKVFEESSVSDCEKSYDGIFVNGEKRNARKLTYEFDKAEVIEFIENLEELFKAPSDKLRAATENLLANKSLTEGIENMGYSLETCDDLAKFIGDLTKLVNLVDVFEVTLEVAFVNDAVTAIVFECAIDNTDIELLVDFGAKPKKNKTILASLSIVNESSGRAKESVYNFEYSVEKIKKVNTVTAVYSTSIAIKDTDMEEKTETSDLFEMKLDKKNETASFSLKKDATYSIGDAESSSETSSYDVSCSMKDRSSKLSFTLLGLTQNGYTVYEPTGDVNVTLFKKPDRIDLGKFTEILKMNVADSDKVVTSAVSQVESMWKSLGNIKPVIVKPGTENEIKSDIYFDGFFVYEYDTYYYDQFKFSGNKYQRWSYDGKSNNIEEGTYFVSGDKITFIPDDAEQYEQNIISAGENSFVIEGNLYEKT